LTGVKSRLTKNFGNLLKGKKWSSQKGKKRQKGRTRHGKSPWWNYGYWEKKKGLLDGGERGTVEKRGRGEFIGGRGQTGIRKKRGRTG